MKRLLIVVIFLLIFSDCFAEPSKTTNYLINEPVSLLDFGLANMRTSLEGDSFYKKDTTDIYTSFDWAHNLILIEIDHNATEEYANDKKPETYKSLCKLLLSHTEMHLTVYGMPRFFSHKGYQKINQPENIGKEISKIVLIKVRIFYRAMDFSQKILCKCESMLTEDTILFEELPIPSTETPGKN